MGLETTSWDWLRDGIKKTIPQFCILERVENGVLDGMGDVNYVIRGNEGWIELKAVELPKRDSTPVLLEKGLSIQQVNWHLLRATQCARTWIFVSAAPYRWLVAGVYANRINLWTRDDFCLNATFWYDEKWGDKEWERLVRVLSWRLGG